MQIVNVLIAIALAVSFFILVGVLIHSIRAHRAATAQLDAAWVVLEAAHPELFPGATHPPFPDTTTW
ncbi:hypothetical protein [Herbiconiux ginsengi]|uniref:Uncharacterized protein n=1 Tax=Herbiconiux ginsengi TaxID=381665 RepID=A0A1H3SPP2_9MICO|nr:hypothetical protein [Herbiconiux ginsengi]SDZ39638.1 hypothetical protein SAMN05216554_3537 [Herbiconiux ginsengi]